MKSLSNVIVSEQNMKWVMPSKLSDVATKQKNYIHYAKSHKLID